jgi:polyprenyldihydroxybenzoate methyltransferase/3-demethylubiquinol 3-O-methyltransferase
VEEGRQFDVVCSLDVLEHVSDPRFFLSTLDKLLKVNTLIHLSPWLTLGIAWRSTLHFKHSQNSLGSISNDRRGGIQTARNGHTRDAPV